MNTIGTGFRQQEVNQLSSTHHAHVWFAVIEWIKKVYALKG